GLGGACSATCRTNLGSLALLPLGDRDPIDVDGLLRLLARDPRARILDRNALDPDGNVEPRDHTPEDRVVRRQTLPIRAGDDEELTAPAVRLAGVGHRERSRRVLLLARVFVLDRV